MLRFITTTTIAATVLLANCLSDTALGQVPASELRGMMELEFSANTQPGGAPSSADPRVRVNVSFAAKGSRVKVDPKGEFSFAAQCNCRRDSFFAGSGIVVENDERRQDWLKGTGTVADDGSLTLKLQWQRGESLLIFTSNPPGGTYTAQHPEGGETVHEWQLQPVSRRVEQLGNDRGRETITYRSRRPSAVTGEWSAPLIERIEIKLVRGLVPRG